MNRKHYVINYSENDKHYRTKAAAPVSETDVKANIVSSEVETPGGFHSPVLDIDFPARLVPSSTQGHFHLYFDGLVIPWSKYEPLLLALADAGVIERGYANAAIDRKASLVRKQGKTKTTDPLNKGEKK